MRKKTLPVYKIMHTVWDDPNTLGTKIDNFQN